MRAGKQAAQASMGPYPTHGEPRFAWCRGVIGTAFATLLATGASPRDHNRTGRRDMRTDTPTTRLGRISYAAIAWLLGLPLPIVIIALLWGGCTNW